MGNFSVIEQTISIRESVREGDHWAIQWGNIDLPAEFADDLDDHSGNLQVLLTLMVRMYIELLCRGQSDVSCRILRYITRLRDPCIAMGICPDEFRESDPFLDFIDTECSDSSGSC